MNIIYCQDQEIVTYNGHFYHTKSEHFFVRFLSGMTPDEVLTVYSGQKEVNNSDIINTYKDVSHQNILYKKMPEFRRIKNIIPTLKIVKKIVQDADFCYLRTGVSGSLASIFCRLYKIPYMAIVNEDVYNNTKVHNNLIIKASSIILLLLNKAMIYNANYACYVTNKYLQNKYPCKGQSIGCSDIEFLDINQNEFIERIKKIKTKTGKIILGTAGSVSTDLKGQDTVIKTIAELKKNGFTEFEYQLVGTGNPKRLRNLAVSLDIADQVLFLGEYNHDDVMKWFENIDIYLHPSRSEGLPRTIIEAMTKACPCICSSVGGVPELIDKEFLFSYKKSVVSDLKKIIIKMDKNNMINQSKINFERSKLYDPIILEEKRRKFFERAIYHARYK